MNNYDNDLTLFFSECNITVPSTPATAENSNKIPISTSVSESQQQNLCQSKFLDHQNQKTLSPLSSSDQQSPPLNQPSPSMVSQNMKKIQLATNLATV